MRQSEDVNNSLIHRRPWLVALFLKSDPEQLLSDFLSRMLRRLSPPPDSPST